MTKLAILGEYFGSLVPVKIQHVERFNAEPKADRKDGSGGSAGNQVEVLHDLIAAAAFHHVVPFCQDGRCERSSQAAAIERQDAEKTSSRDVFANQRQQFDLRDDAIDQFGNVGAFSQGPVLPRRHPFRSREKIASSSPIYPATAPLKPPTRKLGLPRRIASSTSSGTPARALSKS